MKKLGFIFLSIVLFACDKQEIKHPCYSKSLEEASKDQPCTMDCPGVVGCDGKTYCNSCDAAKHGISVKDDIEIEIKE